MNGGGFDGRTVVVTRGVRGIGQRYARAFAVCGAHVVVADLLEDEGERPAGELGGLFVATDVSDEASTRALAGAAADRFGGMRAGGLPAHGLRCRPHPGLVSNDASRAVNDEAYLGQAAHARAVHGDMLPDDLVGAVLFLGSEGGAFVSGQTLLWTAAGVMS